MAVLNSNREFPLPFFSLGGNVGFEKVQRRSISAGTVLWASGTQMEISGELAEKCHLL